MKLSETIAIYLAAVGCFAASVGILAWITAVVRDYGWGFFPGLCVVVALTLGCLGLGLVLRRPFEMLGLACRIALIFLEFWP